MTLLLALACAAGPGAAPVGGADDSGAPLLTVTGGYGGGRHAAGSAVHVWAAVDPHAAIVTGWTGEDGLLASPGEWNSAMTMPDQDVVLAPVVVEVPLEPSTRSPGEGVRPYTLVGPEAPVGIVLFFHGAAYSRAQLDDAAAASVARRLVHAGYAVAALDSEAAATNGTGGWSADSGDLAYTQAVVASLGAALGEVPVYAWGMSSGGQFAHLVGAELPAQGVLASCAPGSADLAARTGAPTAWFLAGADGTFPTAPEDAAAYAAQLQQRGLAAAVHVHPPTPLYDQRFTRVPGVDEAASTALADWLRAQGHVDADGAWLVSGRSASAALLQADLGLDPETATAVAAEIEIMAADHELYDDLGAAMVGFLDGLR